MGMIEVGEDGELHDAVWHRRYGMKALFDARMVAKFGAKEGAAEHAYRRAIELLTEAFLLDRHGQADCFAHAHRAGEEVNALVGCPYEYDAASAQYRMSCPVFALHAYFGTSIAWSLSTACSICGARAFECQHAPGDEYEGQVCSFQPDGVLNWDHLALTPNPDFSYTWHWPKQYSAQELVAEGVIARPGEPATCNHCQDCNGRWGPQDEDLDPVARWARVRDEEP